MIEIKMKLIIKKYRIITIYLHKIFLRQNYIDQKL